MGSEEVINSMLESLLREELKAVNYSLPKRRKSLRELLNEEYPFVELRDGGTHMFRKSELELARELLNDEEVNELKLPIILEVTTSGDKLAAEISEKPAIKLICRILNMEEPIRPPLTLYPIQIAALRRKIGTLLMYAISYKELT